jgi:hypothetical protein
VIGNGWDDSEMLHREDRGGDWMGDDLVAGKNDNHRNALIEKPITNCQKRCPFFSCGILS